MLVFKLEEEQLIMAAGRTRWLANATREVEAVLAEIKRRELERAVELQDVAREMGMETAPSLRELVDLVPSPWDKIFGEHRQALLEVAQEIDSVASANRDLLTRGQQAAREAIATIGQIEIESYTPNGAAADRPMSLRLIDEAI
jgi:hypothetical protein